MSPSTRLRLSAVMIVLSVVYAVLAAQSPDVATALAVGYVALLLTLFFVSNLWKRP